MNILVTLIPLFPLLGFLILGLGFRTIPRKIASILGPAMVGIPFILSVIVLINIDNFASVISTEVGTSLTQQLNNSTTQQLFEWISFGTFSLPFSFLVDPLSCLMLLIITGVGFIIHVYSVGYMAHDAGFNRFFAYMNLFVFFMLLLVLGASYPVMFIGWEGVGLCSYLLIGFWFKNHEFNAAANKAFIMNRIGDLGFLLGMFLIYTTFNSLNFTDVFSKAGMMTPGSGVMIAITLLLFVGAVGKSAQIPLYTWLPDAMAGPTPVSALIHAATMVTAGVYMIARSNILYALAPFTMSVITVISLSTALLAAIIALWQTDIKKILAYSTISQLGYMFLALSMGAFSGAMFHLTTHAFFKALLFLAAGSVIHALNGEQDIRNMGGLRKKIPLTWQVFLVGTIAISGIPPFSGFFSKDAILMNVFSYSIPVWLIALLGSLLTALYMFRLLFLTFAGTYKGTDEQAGRIHESPRIMTWPLVILAFLSAAAGVLNLPEIFDGNMWLSHFLNPVFNTAYKLMEGPLYIMEPRMEWLLMAITVVYVIIVVGIAYSRFVQKRRRGGVQSEVRKSWMGNFLERKLYVDELYDFILVKPLFQLSKFFDRFVETKLIDNLVNGTGRVTLKIGNTIRFIQTGHVGFYLFIMVISIIAILVFNVLI